MFFSLAHMLYIDPNAILFVGKALDLGDHCRSTEDAFDAISIRKRVDVAAGACGFLVFWPGEGAEVGEWSGYVMILDESASSALRNTGNGRMVYEPNTPELCLAIQEAGEHAREHARVRKARSGERCTYQKVPIETLSIFFAVKRRR